MCFSIPSVGFYVDNEVQFVNIKMDELIARLGVTVRYGLAYSTWSNSINKRNHASFDITIKKLRLKKRVTITDLLLKAAS